MVTLAFAMDNLVVIVLSYHTSFVTTTLSGTPRLGVRMDANKRVLMGIWLGVFVPINMGTSGNQITAWRRSGSDRVEYDKIA
ncbi:hypothetical protein I7I50_04624 [Histoplasma capsulatum G186AR]|uniref:Uncharacterized protein n=1 Tax=Ajellomyces capsulatus TaxID=5037 RepID=A0A8H7YMX8_AJECA|nr:hypothetical protein I7I52_05533 [Histoplasma capsulatum]QSS75478.1 hypothetical protein I7I50_04624 [Histoplasma capsulatum G186AR]